MEEQKVKLTQLPEATDTTDTAVLLVNQNETDQRLPITHLLRAKNNLSELENTAQARANLGVPSVEDVNDKIEYLIDGKSTFLNGATLESERDFIWDDNSKSWYYWTGTFSKEVPAASTPESTGGIGAGKWLSVGDATLRGELADDDGYTLIPSLQTFNDLYVNPFNENVYYENTIVNKNITPKENSRNIEHKQNGILRFVTWNLWTGPSTDAYYNGDRFSPTKALQQQKQFLDSRGDYFCFQECFTSPVIDSTYLQVNPLSKSVFSMAMNAGGGNLYGLIDLTKLNIKSHTSKIYDDKTPTSLDSETRVYSKTIIDGDIFIYNTHLSTDPARATNMLSELLIEVTGAGKDKVVIMGDFNTSDSSKLSGFESAGFVIVNKSEWDTSIDRILVKGMSISGYGKVQILGKMSHLSDHDMYYVDLEVAL